jgi:hypothetical protein
MTTTGTGTDPANLEQEQDLFESANLYPRNTGLPMTVWASPRARAQHDARIKVCMTPGDRMDVDNTAVVSLRPQPRLLHGTLAPADWRAVQAWATLNLAVLIDYWDGVIDTLEFVQRLRKV